MLRIRTRVIDYLVSQENLTRVSGVVRLDL